MELALAPIFIINVVINSLLSFFTVSLFIFLAIKVLRIKNPRMKAFCLFFPFAKIVLDIATYQFSNWALAQQINPFTCPEGSRMFSLIFSYASIFYYPHCSIYFHLVQGQTFTLADLFCLFIGPKATLIFAIGLAAGILGSLGRAAWQCYFSYQWIEKMRTTSTLYSHPLQDPFLQSNIQRKKITIYLTQTSHSPFIAGQRHPSIFISRALIDQLSPQEFEAIIAHEIAHLRHGDLLFNAALFWICHFFWWIPTRYMKNQLELAQEYACDRLLSTPLYRLPLAEALYKTSAWLHASPLPFLVQPFATPHYSVKRLQTLLGEAKPKELRIFKWMKMLFLMIWMIALSLGKFWTF